VSFGGSSLSVPNPDGNWHQWSVTFDQSTGNLAIYEDTALCHNPRDYPASFITPVSTARIFSFQGFGTSIA
jgi:hypothetical protein